MLDCGSTLTVVAPRLLNQLNAAPGPVVRTQTAGGSVSVRLYSISFPIYNLQTPAVVLSREDWLVANLAQDLDDVDVL